MWFPRGWCYDETDNEGKLVNDFKPARGMATTRDDWQKWEGGVTRRA